MNGRRPNRHGYWKSFLSPSIERIQYTISKDIEDTSGALTKGISRFTAQAFMLNYLAREDSDKMVYETFKEEVEQTTRAAKKPWATQLVIYLRGPEKKRSGIEYNAFGEAQFVLAYLLEYYNPIEEPTEGSVYKFITTFPGQGGLPNGFNAIRLQWDRIQVAKAEKIERQEKIDKDKIDGEAAIARDFLIDIPTSQVPTHLLPLAKKNPSIPDMMTIPDLDRYRMFNHLRLREESEAQTRERLNNEIIEITRELIDGSEIVKNPLRDGSLYMWADEHWCKIPNSVRDRMILRGGRSRSANH